MGRGARTGWVLAGLLAFVFAGAGCASQSKTGAQSGAGKPTGSEFDQGPVGGSSGTQTKALPLETVYFDFDRYEIRSDARTRLRGNADAIKANVSWGVITIEGHCDERGSEEYNLALGERRANAVKRYLVDLGVPSSRLRTVSFGEAKPAVVGHDESAWRYNRRAEFKAGS